MPRESGRVLLVGAGPGAADLLTLRAARAIEAAGAVLYDALVGEEILALAPAGCLKIQTGKRARRSIRALMVCWPMLARPARLPVWMAMQALGASASTSGDTRAS